MVSAVGAEQEPEREREGRTKPGGPAEGSARVCACIVAAKMAFTKKPEIDDVGNSNNLDR